LINQRLAIAMTLQIAAGAMLLGSPTAAEPSATCDEENVGEYWCSQCYESPPNNWMRSKYQCVDKGDETYGWSHRGGWSFGNDKAACETHLGNDEDCDGDGSPGGAT
jgi:hypothetical protein